jgi:ATP-dependent DNA helicase RecQ
MSRDAFEEVLGAMARAGLVRLSDAVFEKDGKQIPYRKVSLTRAAHAVDEQTPIAFIIKDFAPASATGKNKEEGRHAREAHACGATGKGSPAKARVIGPTRRIGFPYRSGPASVANGRGPTTRSSGVSHLQ